MVKACASYQQLTCSAHTRQHVRAARSYNMFRQQYDVLLHNFTYLYTIHTYTLQNEAIADHRFRQLFTTATSFNCHLCPSLSSVCHEVHTLCLSFRSPKVTRICPFPPKSFPQLLLQHCCICLTANFTFHIFMRWHACANAVAKPSTCLAKKKASSLISSVAKSNSGTCACCFEIFIYSVSSVFAAAYLYALSPTLSRRLVRSLTGWCWQSIKMHARRPVPLSVIIFFFFHRSPTKAGGSSPAEYLPQRFSASKSIALLPFGKRRQLAAYLAGLHE